jgi:glycosyltransferase involved in cell wall biosynthesis
MGVTDRLVLTRLQVATRIARRAVASAAARAARHAPPPREGPMRVLLLASQPASHAATRYRIATWAERLRRAGHDAVVSLPVEGDEGERLFHRMRADRAAFVEQHLRTLASRRRAVEDAAGFDVAVIHLSDVPYWEYGEPFVAEALTKTAGRVLLDLDDLPVVRGEPSPAPRARRLVLTVDGLVLGNRELRKWFPRPAAWIVPTCIDVGSWPAPDRSSRAGPPVVGWIGTPGGQAALEALAPVLAAACARHGARVRVIGEVPPRLPGVPSEFVEWRGGREAEDLSAIDVGVAPLSDGPATRCKCGLKALQYAASGAAVVASPVGALADIVVHGETGIHATGHDEWAAALDALLADAALRRRMGDGGRAAVLARWSYDVHAAEFERALRGIEPGT